MKKSLILLIVTVAVVGITVYFWLQANKKNKNEELSAEATRILDNIKEGVGEKGEDINIILRNVRPDEAWNGNATADKLHATMGRFIDDDVEARRILSTLSKARIKQLDIVLRQRHGVSLNDFFIKMYADNSVAVGMFGGYITSLIGGDSWFDVENWKKTITIIKNAR